MSFRTSTSSSCPASPFLLGHTALIIFKNMKGREFQFDSIQTRHDLLDFAVLVKQFCRAVKRRRSVACDVLQHSVPADNISYSKLLSTLTPSNCMVSHRIRLQSCPQPLERSLIPDNNFRLALTRSIFPITRVAGKIDEFESCEHIRQLFHLPSTESKFVEALATSLTPVITFPPSVTIILILSEFFFGPHHRPRDTNMRCSTREYLRIMVIL